jgi:antitoxin component YwqK of YwqJK toxin-antitoxin module
LSFTHSRFLLLFGVLLLFSCGEESVEKLEEIPKDWQGEEEDFKKNFTTKSEGNSSIVVSSETNLPLEGKVERNSSVSSTSQNFSGGKLNGVSVKKSKDGSWVKAHYRDGILHGEMIFYSNKGKVRTILNYDSGALTRRKKPE